MLNKAFSGGVSMSLLLAVCVATSGCVYERYLGGEGGAGGDGGHETVGNPDEGCDSGAGGHSAVGGGPHTGEGGHEMGGGSATGEGGFGGGGIDTGTGEGGQGGGGVCVGCAEYLTDNMLEEPLCPGFSQQIYDGFMLCVCDGACEAVCADSACTGVDPTAACLDCVLDTNVGCGVEYAECANDIP